MSEEVFGMNGTGKGATYRDYLRRKTPCLDCRVEMKAGSVTAHRQRLHVTDQEINCYRIPVSQHDPPPPQVQVYGVIFPNTTIKCQ